MARTNSSNSLSIPNVADDHGVILNYNNCRSRACVKLEVSQ